MLYILQFTTFHRKKEDTHATKKQKQKIHTPQS
jgi:hypothetical protein